MIYLDHQQKNLASIRAVFTIIVAPIQYAVDFPFRLLFIARSHLSSHQSLINENTTLKGHQILLQAQLQKLIALERDNATLRALLTSLPQTNQKIIRMEIGRLLAVNEAPYSQEVIVDKGSRVGVYVGQPVLDASGIMGQVVSVGPLTSRILLITDIRSAVPVENSRNGARSIAVGQGAAAGQLALTHVLETAENKAGDLLVTSGLGGNYPAGYPVGIISQIRMMKSTYPIILVKPNAHLDRNMQVLLIWPAEKNIFIDVPPEPKIRKSSVHKAIEEGVR